MPSMRTTLYTTQLTCLLLAGLHTASAQENGLLWKIEAPNLESPSYLYGTIHLIPEEYFTIDTSVMDALEEADRAIFEINLNAVQDLVQMSKMIQLPDNKVLSAYATPEEYSLLSQYLQDSVGIPIANFERFKPIMLQQFLMTGNAGVTLASYDMHFSTWCAENNKEIGALETAAQQIGYLDSIPFDKQIDWLLDDITSGGQSDSLFHELAKAYQNRDLDALYDLINASGPEFTDYADILLYDRNVRWTAMLDTWMKEESLFIAVGAGHLPGEKGLIQLLREKGYQVTNIF